MATSSITITTTAQSISGSDVGCTVIPNGSIQFGTGATEPEVWADYHYEMNESINYSGDYGLLWVKTRTGSVSAIVLGV